MGASADEVRLETSRLILRPWRPADFDALYRIFSDAAMFAYSHRGEMTTEESWSLLLRQIGHWAVFGYGVFAVLEKRTGDILGEVGPAHFRRLLGVDFDDAPEMTWSIVPHAQGQGYATEAAAAVHAWAAARGIARTVCLIHEENRASLAVAEKLGYLPLRTIQYRGYPARLFEFTAGAAVLSTR